MQNAEIYLTHFWQKFHESNVFTKEVTKELISRKKINSFAKKSWGHSVQCGNFANLLWRIFAKNFVKATFLLKKLLKRRFDEIFFQWEQIFHFTTLWGDINISHVGNKLCYTPQSCKIQWRHFGSKLKKLWLMHGWIQFPCLFVYLQTSCISIHLTDRRQCQLPNVTPTSPLIIHLWHLLKWIFSTNEG